jgi:hypothetical protein
MATIFEAFGIDPEEAAAALLDGYMATGMDAADAMRAAAEGTEEQARQEYVPFTLHRLDGGGEER